MQADSKKDDAKSRGNQRQYAGSLTRRTVAYDARQGGEYPYRAEDERKERVEGDRHSQHRAHRSEDGSTIRQVTHFELRP